MMNFNPIVKMSTYFMPTRREAPAEAEIISHQYMLRAGMVRQEASGIYSWLPLGLRVLNKIAQIVREEQNKIGAHEVLMPTLQPADIWRKSGRYDGYGKEMLRIKDRHQRDLLYGPTNEEMITLMAGDHINSYKQLPLMLYHIQWKFRDEIRPRFGVMRGREFLMKDAYSFSADMETGEHQYHQQFIAYLRTYARMGLKAIPMAADTGPIGGDNSHEFIILADTGESAVWCDQALLELDLSNQGVDDQNPADLKSYIDKITALYSATDEQHDQAEFEQAVPQERRLNARGIEVGHIFFFGDKYASPLNAKFTDKDGSSQPLRSGSYGVGISRLVGAIIEASHDDKGIIWPLSVAPFHVAINLIRHDDSQSLALCDTVCDKLQVAGFDIMVDDRNERAGVKYADLELIGIPFVITIGPRGAKTGTLELTIRKNGEKHEGDLDAILEMLPSHIDHQ
ncbi:MAG: proline--tRNA ligase [Alphaproteobacteria bacterium]